MGGRVTRLHEVEPRFGPGESQSLAAVIRQLMKRKARLAGSFLLAIDGRSSSGKSRLADRIAALLPRTAIVHTDDVAWWHSRFGWDDLLLSGVIEPLRRGDAVDFRPPAWDERGRQGSISVPDDVDLVVIEGGGAGRASLAPHMDAVIWVQTDLDLTERRDRERIAAGEIDQEGYEHWMAEEVPFQATERTWERADLIVAGSSDEPSNELTVLRGGPHRGS